MKKIIIPIAILTFLVVGAVIFKTTNFYSEVDLIPLILILLLSGVSVVLIIKRLISVKKSEPIEDELSKRILEKTSSLSYYISLYMWLCFTLMNNRAYSNEQIIGYGIVGMAVIFAVVWVYFKIKGIGNE